MWIIGKDEDKKETHVIQRISSPCIVPETYSGKISQTLVAVCNTAAGTRQSLLFWTRFLKYLRGCKLARFDGKSLEVLKYPLPYDESRANIRNFFDRLI